MGRLVTWLGWRTRGIPTPRATRIRGGDAMVFTGGIGENSTKVRESVCSHLEFLGVDFSADANNSGPKERIKERLALWLDSPVTTLNIMTFSIDGLRVMAELVL